MEKRAYARVGVIILVLVMMASGTVGCSVWPYKYWSGTLAEYKSEANDRLEQQAGKSNTEKLSSSVIDLFWLVGITPFIVVDAVTLFPLQYPARAIFGPVWDGDGEIWLDGFGEWLKRYGEEHKRTVTESLPRSQVPERDAN